jgi:hypothetical protein
MMAHDMIAVRLSGPIRFVIAGAPKYFKRMGRPKHPKDLLSHDCIRMRVGENELYDRWEFEDRGKDFQVEVKGSLIMNDSILGINAALEGSGVIYYAENRVGRTRSRIGTVRCPQRRFLFVLPKTISGASKMESFYRSY